MPTDTTPITVSEAALRLGCSPRTIRRLIASGDLPAYRLRDSRTSPYYITNQNLIAYARKRGIPTDTEE